MARFNYDQICQDLIKDLSSKQKEIILRRFALQGGKRETLEAIGKDLGITRERVRQIKEGGMSQIRPKIKNYQGVFRYLKTYFQKFGGLKNEKDAFCDLAGDKWQNQIYFLLNLDGGFERFRENKNFWTFWAADKDGLNKAKEAVDLLYKKIQQIGKPLFLKEVAAIAPVKGLVLEAYLGISKKILKNKEGLFGLKIWPEINPRGVKDKAYLVFKKEQKPLHFRDLSQMIEGSLVQTVHNELIRDSRFVLVGRGIYALQEWGYKPGQVKDVIQNILKEEGRPLAKDEIIGKVLKQRMVAQNTILLNLGDKDCFQKDSQGKYWVRES
ncbi:MAG: sigma factor-like helix-turn-helix DNA-binding protein [bacterium]